VSTRFVVKTVWMCGCMDLSDVWICRMCGRMCGQRAKSVWLRQGLAGSSMMASPRRPSPKYQLSILCTERRAECPPAVYFQLLFPKPLEKYFLGFHKLSLATTRDD
jgi:hypothetical protein